MNAAPVPDFQSFRQHTFVMLGICIAALGGIAIQFLMAGTLSILGILFFVLCLPSVKSIKVALGDEERYRRDFDPSRFMLGQLVATDRKPSWSPVTYFVVFAFFGMSTLFMGAISLATGFPMAIFGALFAGIISVVAFRGLARQVRTRTVLIILGVLLAIAAAAWMSMDWKIT